MPKHLAEVCCDKLISVFVRTVRVSGQYDAVTSGRRNNDSSPSGPN
jgi:hypothetical protein